jgi:hypothetical protein
MLSRTRVAGGLDTSRLGASLARPGIDTRTWVSLAVATADCVVDEAHGVFVEVQLHPTGEFMTARVGAEYAGSGFGFYVPIFKDDELVVGLPSGDPREGPVVQKRLWSAADLPPGEAAANPKDVLLVVQKDRTLRIRATGEGNIEVNSEGTVSISAPSVLIGGTDAASPAVLGNALRDALTDLVQSVVGGTALLQNPVGFFLSSAPGLPVMVNPLILPFVEAWIAKYLTPMLSSVVKLK